MAGRHRATAFTSKGDRAKYLIRQSELPSRGFCTFLGALIGVVVAAGIQFGAVKVVAPDVQPVSVVTADAPVVATVAWHGCPR